jgi:hypothetical protein
MQATAAEFQCRGTKMVVNHSKKPETLRNPGKWQRVADHI